MQHRTHYLFQGRSTSLDPHLDSVMRYLSDPDKSPLLAVRSSTGGVLAQELQRRADGHIWGTAAYFFENYCVPRMVMEAGNNQADRDEDELLDWDTSLFFSQSQEMAPFLQPGNSALVLGEGGLGKTTAAYYLFYKLAALSREIHEAPLPVMLDANEMLRSETTIRNLDDLQPFVTHTVSTENINLSLLDNLVFLVDGLDRVPVEKVREFFREKADVKGTSLFKFLADKRHRWVFFSRESLLTADREMAEQLRPTGSIHIDHILRLQPVDRLAGRHYAQRFSEISETGSELHGIENLNAMEALLGNGLLLHLYATTVANRDEGDLLNNWPPLPNSLAQSLGRVDRDGKPRLNAGIVLFSYVMNLLAKAYRDDSGVHVRKPLMQIEEEFCNRRKEWERPDNGDDLPSWGYLVKWEAFLLWLIADPADFTSTGEIWLDDDGCFNNELGTINRLFVERRIKGLLNIAVSEGVSEEDNLPWFWPRDIDNIPFGIVKEDKFVISMNRVKKIADSVLRSPCLRSVGNNAWDWIHQDVGTVLVAAQPPDWPWKYLNYYHHPCTMLCSIQVPCSDERQQEEFYTVQGDTEEIPSSEVFGMWLDGVNGISDDTSWNHELDLMQINTLWVFAEQLQSIIQHKYCAERSTIFMSLYYNSIAAIWAELEQCSAGNDYQKACGNLEKVLTNWSFLEEKCSRGMVRELAEDFERAAQVLPEEHPRKNHFRLLAKAIRFDLHFLQEHPESLFQCLYNTCWWYDSPEAKEHYREPEGGWPENVPWKAVGPKLYELIDEWRKDKAASTNDWCWLRSMRPSDTSNLGSPIEAWLIGHTSLVHSIEYSNDGRILATGGYDNTIRLWDANNHKTLHVLNCRDTQKDASIEDLAFSPDSRVLASAHADGHIRLWDTNTGALLHDFEAHQEKVSSVSFSPDGSSLVSGSGFNNNKQDNSVRLWDLDSMKQIHQYDHEEMVRALAFSPDGSHLIFGSYHGLTLLNQRLERIPENRAIQGTQALCYTEDGAELLVATSSGEVHRLDPHTLDGTLLCRGAFGIGGILGIACRKQQLFLAGYDGTIETWNLQSGQRVARFNWNNGSFCDIAVTPDAGRCAVGGWHGSLAVVNLNAMETHLESQLQGHDNMVICMQSSRSEDILATGGRDGNICIWGFKEGRLRDTINAHSGHVNDIKFVDEKGSRQASCSHDGTVKVWDLESGDMIMEGCQESQVYCLAVPSDATRILSGGYGRYVHLWNIDSGEELLRLKVDGDAEDNIAIYKLGFSEDDRRIWAVASAEPHPVTYWWDIESGNRLEGHEDFPLNRGRRRRGKSGWNLDKANTFEDTFLSLSDPEGTAKAYLPVRATAYPLCHMDRPLWAIQYFDSNHVAFYELCHE